MDSVVSFWLTSRTVSGKSVFQARFHDESGKILCTRNIRASSERAAKKAADALIPSIRDSLAAKAQAPDTDPYALDYLRAFWRPGSDYQLSKRLRGTELSCEYMKDSLHRIENHAVPFLTGIKFRDISPALLEKMVRDLSREGKSGRTVNQTLQAIKVPYADYCRLNQRPNALTSVLKLKEGLKPRGALSVDEMRAIIALPNLDTRLRAAVLIAGLCGLRAGEIRGLELDDIDNGMIRVRHNFVDGPGRKAPKWGSCRDVPCPELVMDAIRLCVATRPEKYSGPYVLWNQRTMDAPCSLAFIESGFRGVILPGIGIDEATRRQRRLVFHGLRHSFVSATRSAGVPDHIVRAMAGHSTLEMTDRYTHASTVDFADARKRLESAMTGRTAVNPTLDRIAELESELARLRGYQEAQA